MKLGTDSALPGQLIPCYRKRVRVLEEVPASRRLEKLEECGAGSSAWLPRETTRWCPKPTSVDGQNSCVWGMVPNSGLDFLLLFLLRLMLNTCLYSFAVLFLLPNVGCGF